VPWHTAPEGLELWTRSVLLNEILLDIDARPWRCVARAMDKLVVALRDHLQVPVYDHESGGKGAHASIFLDPTSIKDTSGILARANRAGIDIWSITRITVANAFLDAAGFPPGDSVRWTAPVGNGIFDRLKVKWNADRRGSMVRVIGTPGSAGFRKTLVPDNFSWSAAATWEAPKPQRLRFHDTPQLWGVPAALNDRILAQVEEATHAAEATLAEGQKENSQGSLKALAAVKACPCVAKILAAPAPPGTRHYAFLNLAVTSRALGLPRAGAENLLRKALGLCGLDEGDGAWQVLQDVYDGHYSLASPRCPSPHVSGWCQPNACPLSRRLTFN
jgi:hypothetical protein